MLLIAGVPRVVFVVVLYDGQVTICTPSIVYSTPSSKLSTNSEMVSGVFLVVVVTRGVVGSDEDGRLVEEVVAGVGVVSVLEDELFSFKLDSKFFDVEEVEAREVVESGDLDI